MLRLQICLVTIGLVLMSVINAQHDNDICPEGPSAFVADPSWTTIPLRFEIFTELVASDGIIELSQAFSTQRDSILTNTPKGAFNFYWNYETNEQFEVGTAVIGQTPVPICFRQVINKNSETSVLETGALILKPSVLLGFGPRNQRNADWGNLIAGEQMLRGIPTIKFKSCFYLKDILATVAVTYYVSDVTKFQGYLPRNQSIILQMDVRIRNDAGKYDAYTYNVFRYSPNPRGREERQALETPAGVFCPNRTQTLPVPTNIPDRVSSNSEAFVAEANRSIISTHTLYDTESQFTRFDVWYPDIYGRPIWEHYTGIQDFGTGLSYSYNHTTRQCTVSNISVNVGDGVPVDGRPDLVQMGSGQHLFLMDDITYHYTGEKQCRDRVWCHVWIGEKIFSNGTVQHREWYWASRINDIELTQYIPMKLILKTSVNRIPQSAYEINIFNYRRNPMTIFEIDYTLADCYRALGPDNKYNLAVLSFAINNDKRYEVFQNLNYMRLHIYETLLFTLFVRPIRIANLIVDKNHNNITVTFTLLDAPPSTGPVEDPIQETSLDTLIERLTSIIDSNGLAFRAKNGTKYIVLRARPNSLNVRHRSTENKTKSSGPRITGLWLGFVFGTLVVGTVGGYFIFKKLAEKYSK